MEALFYDDVSFPYAHKQLDMSVSTKALNDIACLKTWIDPTVLNKESGRLIDRYSAWQFDLGGGTPPSFGLIGGVNYLKFSGDSYYTAGSAKTQHAGFDDSRMPKIPANDVTIASLIRIPYGATSQLILGSPNNDVVVPNFGITFTSGNYNPRIYTGGELVDFSSPVSLAIDTWHLVMWGKDNSGQSLWSAGVQRATDATTADFTEDDFILGATHNSSNVMAQKATVYTGGIWIFDKNLATSGNAADRFAFHAALNARFGLSLPVS